jgi:hypothetical protein
MKWARLWAITAILVSLPPLLAMEKQEVEAESARFLHPDELRKGDGFAVLADRRIFATLAFLNAVGYDEEVNGLQMTPTRVKVRRLVQDNLAASPDKLDTWRNYYAAHHYPEYIFVHFALSMNADYPFRRIRPRTELWSARIAEELAEFPGILNDFWKVTKLEEIWQEVKPDYLAELARYDFSRMSSDVDGM